MDDNLTNMIRGSAMLQWEARNKQPNILCVRQINQVAAKSRKTGVANLPRGRTRPVSPIRYNNEIYELYAIEKGKVKTF